MKTTLGELAKVQTGPFGSQLHASDYTDEGVPVVMPMNIGENRVIESGIMRTSAEDAERLSRHKLQFGDIVYSRRGDIERRALIRETEVGWLCGTGCLLVRPNQTVVDPEWLSFWLGTQSSREFLTQHAVGATMLNLNTGILASIPVDAPPLAEQRRIAEILGALDDKIELNRRMNATLEEMARALFRSWFVDFDPVKVKARGGDPTAELGLAPEIAALFPNSFQDSPLGPIPTGWKTHSLGEMLEFIGGGTPKTSKPEYWGGDIPWFAVTDAPTDTDMWVLDTAKKITDEGLRGSSTRLLPTNTVIISARGTVGKVAITGVPMAMNQSCYAIRSKLGSLNFWTYFLVRQAVSDLKARAHGSVFDTITRATFDQTLYPVPCERVLNAYDELIAGVMRLARANLMESRTLAETRDYLLPRLLSRPLCSELAHA